MNQLKKKLRKKCRCCIQKQLDERYIKRDYDKDTLSSKFDVLIRTNDPANSDKGHQQLNLNLQSNNDKKLDYQNQLESDNDESLQKSFSVFYYHQQKFVYCKESCYLFRKEHRLRKVCVWLTESSAFQYLTIAIVILMSVLICLYKFRGPDQDLIYFNYNIKIIFLLFFMVEAGLFIVARGLYMDKGSYLRSLNNIYSFTVILLSVIVSLDFCYFFVARIFYILQVGKSITYFKYSNSVLQMISDQKEALVSVLFQMFFFLSLFAILGVNLWVGKFDYRCRLTPTPINGEWPVNKLETNICGGQYTCQSNETCGSSYDISDDYHINDFSKDVYIPELNYGITTFDNVYQAYLTLYQVILIEDWSNIMYMLIDASDPITPPIYFILVIVIITYFIGNLNIALFFNQWQKVQEQQLEDEKIRDQNLKAHQIPIFKEMIKKRASSQNNQQSQKIIQDLQSGIKGDVEKMEEQMAIVQASLVLNQTRNAGVRKSNQSQVPSPIQSQNNQQQQQQQQQVNINGKSQFGKNPQLSDSDNQLTLQTQNSQNFNVTAKKRQTKQFREAIISQIRNSRRFSSPIEYSPTICGHIKQFCHDLLVNQIFVQTFNFLIFLNLIALSFNDYPEYSDDIVHGLSLLNNMIVIIFVCEDIIKIIAWKKFKSKKFLFSLDITIDALSLFNPISALKGYRILWIFSSQNNTWSGYKILLDALNKSVSTFLNALFVQTVFFFIAAVIGMMLFQNKLRFDQNTHQYSANGVIPRSNFDNIIFAFTTVFQCISGDDWNKVWYQSVRGAGSGVSHAYFFCTTIIGRIIIQNALISIMISNFELARTESDQARARAELVISAFKIKTPQQDQKRQFSISKTFGQGNSQAQLGERRPSVFSQQSIEITGQPSKDVMKDSNNIFLDNKNESFYNKELIENTKKNQNIYNQDCSTLNMNTETAFIQNSTTFKKTQQKLISQTSKVCPLPSSQQGLTQQQQEYQEQQQRMQRKKEFFEKIVKHLSESSMFIFHQNSFIRQSITKLITHNLWDAAVLVLILISSIILAFDNPLDDPSSDFKIGLDIIDELFTILFSIELLFKVIAFGFAYNSKDNKQAFIRNSWNQLDLLVVLFSIIDLLKISNFSGLNSLKSLRALRALRPLRVVSRNESLKLLVSALFQTIPILSTLLFVSGIIFWIMALLMMSQWKGQFQYCSMSNIGLLAQVKTAQDCVSQGGIWLNPVNNYDGVWKSMVNLFKIMIGENWVNTMWQMVDSVGVDQQPIQNYTISLVFVYFILIFVCNFFILNLFIGQVINNFKRIKDDNSGFLYLTAIQKDWVEQQQFMIRRHLKLLIPEPESGFRQTCYQIAMHSYFDRGIIICIFINTVVMGCIYKGIEPYGQIIINQINNVFLIIFHIEAFIKIAAQSWFYFKDQWNKFDFLILALTDSILVMSLFFSISEINTLPIIARALRLGKIVKYIRASKQFKVLIDTIYFLLPQLVNIGILIFLMIFIYSILGMNLFSTVQINFDIQQYPYAPQKQGKLTTDFSTLPGALLILLQCATGQDWDFYMYQLGEQKVGCKDNQSYEDFQANGVLGCGTWMSYPYFISAVLLLRLIMMNLFLALVIEGYCETIRENEAAINPNQMDEFIEKWSDYDPHATGFISVEDLSFLLYDLPAPLGLKDENMNNMKLQYDKLKNQTGMKSYIYNPKRKAHLQKQKIFEALNQFKVKLYQNHKTHFRDVCILMSSNAVQKKYKREKINRFQLIKLDNEYVIKSLRKAWDNQYPAIKRFYPKSDKIYAIEDFAMKCIVQIRRNAQENKRLKSQLLESKFLSKIRNQDAINKLQQQMQDEPQQLPTRNIKRKASFINNTPFNFQQPQKDQNLQSVNPSISPPNLNKLKSTSFFSRMNQQSLNLKGLQHAQTQQQRKNSILRDEKCIQRLHNFHISKAELNQKLPLKVNYDYQSLKERKESIRILPNFNKDMLEDMKGNTGENQGNLVTMFFRDNTQTGQIDKKNITNSTEALNSIEKKKTEAHKSKETQTSSEDEEEQDSVNSIEQQNNVPGAPKIYLRRRSSVSQLQSNGNKFALKQFLSKVKKKQSFNLATAVDLDEQMRNSMNLNPNQEEDKSLTRFCRSSMQVYTSIQREAQQDDSVVKTTTTPETKTPNQIQNLFSLKKIVRTISESSLNNNNSNNANSNSNLNSVNNNQQLINATPNSQGDQQGEESNAKEQQQFSFKIAIRNATNQNNNSESANQQSEEPNSQKENLTLNNELEDTPFNQSLKTKSEINQYSQNEMDEDQAVQLQQEKKGSARIFKKSGNYHQSSKDVREHTKVQERKEQSNKIVVDVKSLGNNLIDKTEQEQQDYVVGTFCSIEQNLESEQQLQQQQQKSPSKKQHQEIAPSLEEYQDQMDNKKLTNAIDDPLNQIVSLSKMNESIIMDDQSEKEKSSLEDNLQQQDNEAGKYNTNQSPNNHQSPEQENKDQ